MRPAIALLPLLALLIAAPAYAGDVVIPDHPPPILPTPAHSRLQGEQPDIPPIAINEMGRLNITLGKVQQALAQAIERGQAVEAALAEAQKIIKQGDDEIDAEQDRESAP